ncbi:hypothetical protein [Blastococcus saxobsidens]|uniref:Fibronectin type-III domain-containing protein n=1 Tax=Blastococcus saxobsidens TaxID=138336 RepID=A0A4V2G1T8_9ACTN|nr:hypothetical protein [Blastococcus saxobsidens]RZU30566.1 hypothetical protein BKA19_0186 [Blastococcus saxobsidens]
MNSSRRLLTVLGLAVTVVVGSGISASASFSDTAALPTVTLDTLTVQPPTQVEALLVSCMPAEDTVVVEWQYSGSRGVSGYHVRVHLSDGSSSVVAKVGASTKEVLVTLDAATLASSPAFTVTTLTSYGWTARSVGYEGPKC